MTRPNRFIIGGLPRSGTAWIAMLLSLHEDVFCWHEAIQYGDRFKSYTDAIDHAGQRAEFVGDSTTAILPVFDSVRARRVFIIRNAADCKRSYVTAMGEEAEREFQSITANAARWLERHKPMRVLFEDVFSKHRDVARATCASIVDHVTDGAVDFNDDAFDLCYEKEVQIFGLGPEFYRDKSIIVTP